MNEVMVKYDGRLVPEKGFRAFIHGAKGEQKLVESWKEYEAHIQTGIWFSSAQLASDSQKARKKVE